MVAVFERNSNSANGPLRIAGFLIRFCDLQWSPEVVQRGTVMVSMCCYRQRRRTVGAPAWWVVGRAAGKRSITVPGESRLEKWPCLFPGGTLASLHRRGTLWLGRTTNTTRLQLTALPRDAPIAIDQRDRGKRASNSP